MIAFGGAGPLHAVAIAREISIPQVVIPKLPGNFSALGMLMAQWRQDFVRTLIGELDRLQITLVTQAFADLRDSFRRDEDVGFKVAVLIHRGEHGGSRDIVAQVNRDIAHDAVEGSADIQLTKNIFSGRIRALRLSRLGFHARDLGLRITLFLFLLYQFEVRFRAGKLIFRLFHFAGGSRALLLQTLQSFKIASRRVPLVAGFHQRSFEPPGPG